MSTLRLNGRYAATKAGAFHENYYILMDVKETKKSMIFQLVDFQTRYGASQIEDLFAKAKRIVIRKEQDHVDRSHVNEIQADRCPGLRGHAMRIWSDGSFTLYPYHTGVPYYFEPVEV